MVTVNFIFFTDDHRKFSTVLLGEFFMFDCLYIFKLICESSMHCKLYVKITIIDF